jgi:hypothetical protein
MNIRFKDYLLENVYLRATEMQRGEILDLWYEHKAVPDPSERVRRCREAVYMVRDGASELVGVSTVALTQVLDGRFFYAYRMFIRPQDRIPYLMWAVTDGTRDFLRDFRHPEAQAAGMYIVTENAKLMRPGMKRSFRRHGYDYLGKTPHGLDMWATAFAAAESPNAPAAASDQR